jgi:hypothetical protein
VEIPFVAGKTYENPLAGEEQCEMDVLFTHKDGTVIVRPAFWDGGDCFKVRFAPTLTGIWEYKTICREDPRLDGLGGTVGSNPYTGDLAVYQHGFLDISDNKRYFIHRDGRPFFYLGDTHWSIPFEAFDSSNVAGIASQFKHIVDTRIEQGFTVYQSEMAGPEYYALETFGEEDLACFKDLDKKFGYLARQGMVHANAQLFWVAELIEKRDKYPDEYIEKLVRYWVARYGAWPVMWTCAQESDNDFYYDQEDGQKKCDAEHNPWKIVLKALHRYDAYHHPLSAHMEFASASGDGHGTVASTSSFKHLEGHNWYACQWSPAKKGQIDFRIPKDFWHSDLTKPTVNYEGHYDHFWTKTFGARLQGWTAYLNGMFGYGYGAAGIWLTINQYPDDLAGAYNLESDTNDANDAFISKEEKRMSWDKALLLPAAVQLGKYMRNFFESMEWWKLEPRFDDSEWSHFPEASYALATIGKEAYVCYFYNPDTATGALKNMQTDTPYTASWYKPSTGEYTDIGAIMADESGSWEAPPKPSAEDWVLWVSIR